MEVEAVVAESAHLLGFEKLKEKQVEAVKAFVGGSDVFVSLPTGYGKSHYLCCTSCCV